MSAAIALAPSFGKGVLVIASAFILFIGSVYLLLAAIFGVRMGYLVVAVSFFGWMIILSALWTVGQPKIFGLSGTAANLGPRGTLPYWHVDAAGLGQVSDPRFPLTAKYPSGPWHDPNTIEKDSVSGVSSAIQKYLVVQAQDQLAKSGQRVCPPPVPGQLPEENCLSLDPSTFIVQDIKFTSDGGTPVVGAHAFFTRGGPEVTVFVFRDKGNIPVYSVGFLLASILGFAIHVPFLDKAERKRKSILTGGTAPPWYGPA